ncbi:autotransporter domain-containing protein [Pontixanthobacter sp.]|uniref:autotransporter domain-containing protein n=1 Tax=Pontixanthobacter sp. TaxID=2792078 RepID=UPI003C7BC570
MTRSTNRLLLSSAPFALALAAVSSPAHAIVPGENTNSDDIVDEDDEFAGVGQFFSNSGIDGDTGLGLCTGTLINPRTVLFAAHCVNSLPATAYNDGTRISSFGFNVDNLPAVREWLAPFIDPEGRFVFSTARLTQEEIDALIPNPLLRSTSIANNLFNISQIQYDPRSLQNPQARGFIEADIALATLDTPAANIPTWALLFSILPAPENINSITGTGYNVNITGYGGTGNAFEGDVEGIDFRRRAAENVLGGFLSLDDVDNAIFGPAGPNLPQNLYQTDFDSQTPDNFFFDFNIHGDAARPNEGTTAGGDSGGPLILDAANNAITDEDLVIGVLSGGSSLLGRFSSIGSSSFYQPLALYWQYIVAANPYRYVGAVSGDGDWEDGDHWVSLLDPNYRAIDADGNIVNALPTTPELGLNGTGGDFGLVCVEGISGPALGPNECLDTATGEVSRSGVPADNGDAAAGAGSTSVTGSETSINNIGWADIGVVNGLGSATLVGGDTATGNDAATISALAPPSESAEMEAAPTLPDPTIENGLAGATGFVPDNINPGFTAAGEVINGRYFDVTLSNTGTTTLNSEREIDRLTVSGMAGLNITSGANLDVLIDISQMGGMINVDGGLSSVGDYTLFAGMLTGGGTVTAPFFTNIAGAISPGEMGTIDTLTIDGNAILSSASTLMIDIGPDGASDTLDVTGIANVGGLVSVGSGIFDQVNLDGTQYTIVTADVGVSGTFTERRLSDLISQSFVYGPKSVLLQIDVASFATVIDPDNAVQSAYAQLFDQNRGNAAVAGLYGLDFASAAVIRDTFDRLAPTSETDIRTLTAQSFNQMMQFNDRRLNSSRRSNAGGTLATLSSPFTGIGDQSARSAQPQTAGDLGLAETDIEEGAVADNIAIYFAAGSIDGRGEPMSGVAVRDTDFDGYYLGGGIDVFVSDNTMVGASVYYSDLDANGAFGNQANSEMLTGSVYGRISSEAGLAVKGQFNISDYKTNTSRTVDFLGTAQTLVADRDSTGISGAVGVSYDLNAAIGTFSPGVELRYSKVSSAAVTETGGVAALSFNREKFESTQGRYGIDFATLDDRAVQFRAGVDFVHEFNDGPQLFQANFANGTGPTAAFAYSPTDRNWAELSASTTFGNGPLQLGVGVDTVIGRENFNATTLSASATIKF